MSHHHGHNHDDLVDVEQMFTPEFWDARYSSADRLWSGQPNQRLVEQIDLVPPGTARDVGCGEGGDAIWLASRGWQVTASDVSAVALQRAREHAEAMGSEVASRIVWEQDDMLASGPPLSSYDLVSALYVHPPADRREDLLRRLAAAVRPGGRLLVVGHHPSDLQTSLRRPNLPQLFLVPDHVTSILPSADWEIVTAGEPEREVTDPDGQPVIIRDTVVHARRRD